MSRTEKAGAHLPEYLTEGLVLTVSAGLLAFALLSGKVLSGGTYRFDERVLLALRDPGDPSNPFGPEWLEIVVRDISALGGFTVLTLITLAVCGYLWLRGSPRFALFILISIAGGSLLNTLLKGLFDRPRPDLVPHGTPAALSSFPSGHAMMSTVVFLTLGALLAFASQDRRIKAYILGWAVSLTVLVAFSRVYLGVHWPTDVIAGWVAGSTWALICLMAGRLLQSRTRLLAD
ncbi:MAG: phosphatase PAP2 family protein [Pseudomonadota bacterium]|nr:phosphatase PAP2 family protein [Pseudomonadota bacterium]